MEDGSLSTAAPAAIAAESPQSSDWRTHYPAAARFLRSWTGIFGLAVILILLFSATLGPHLWRHNYYEKLGRDYVGSPQAPSIQHPFGTDYQGRDQFARVLMGTRISIAVGLVSCFINLIVGVGIGVAAGWFGGRIDSMLMRGVDILYSIPLLLVVILLQVFVKPQLIAVFGDSVETPLLVSPDLVSIYIALGLTNWLLMARLARAEVISQSARDYVLAARSLGVPAHRILFHHILPNCLGPLGVAATLSIPEAIFIESFLAFVGLGVSAPASSLGSLASDSLGSLRSAPWLLVFPALVISITMLAFNLFGDGLQDAMDPKTKR